MTYVSCELFLRNTLFETENEWQKTEPVPIPLPRASRNFPDVKTYIQVQKKKFLVLTSGKFLEALGSGIRTGSVFCHSFSVSNNVYFFLLHCICFDHNSFGFFPQSLFQEPAKCPDSLLAYSITFHQYIVLAYLGAYGAHMFALRVWVGFGILEGYQTS